MVDCVEAMRVGSPRLFENWPDNAYITSTVAEGDPIVIQSAPIRLRRQFRMNRQATVSLECRGVLAYWDHRNDELVVHLSTQGGHVIRLGLSQALGLPENKLRVIAPDVGGGFGGKNRLMPEDIAVCAIAMKVGHPVRWIEDRREHLLASVHCRDHFYNLTIAADRDGTLLGIEGDVYIDAGAYSLWPTGSFMEASMASRNLTGPYRIRHLNLKTYTVATNKAPMGPYRGVARPGACFAIERLVDEVARELNREPFDLRRQNIVTSSELPYETAAGMRLDTGDYITSLDTAREMIGFETIRARQDKGEPDGRAIGVGFAFYTEQSGHGITEWAKRKSRVAPGYESANARMLPDGSLMLHVGVQNHGQGHETTLCADRRPRAGARSVADLRALRRHRDRAVRLRHLRARARSCLPAARSRAPAASSPKKSGGSARTCCKPTSPTRVWRRAPCKARAAASASPRSPMRPTCARSTCRPAWIRCSRRPRPTSRKETGGVFAYGTHAVVVAVEPDTGAIEILDYVVSEDCGTMINPMIVDGQVQGGIAQGIGTALYEEIPYDEQGQPLATTLRRLHGALRAGNSHRPRRAHGDARARHRIRRRKASAKAARSRRRPRSPMRSPTPSARSARASTRRR